MAQIEALLTDIDDSHLFTNIHFWFWMGRAINQVCEDAPDIDPIEFRATLDRFSIQVLKTPGVSVTRGRWKIVSQHLSEYYKDVDPKIFIRAREAIDMVYRHSPKIRPHSVESLREIRRMGIKVIAVTHVDAGWHDLKMRANPDLKAQIDVHEVIDARVFKDKDAWLGVMDRNKLLPERVAVFGDSLGGDVLAAMQAGVPAGNVIWARLRSIPNYSIGNPPLGIWVAQDLTEIPKILKAM